MKDVRTAAIAELTHAGWTIHQTSGELDLPTTFLRRYSWVPKEVISLLCGLELAVAPDEKLWLVTGGIVRRTTDSAFAADEFERLSLDASAGDEPELRRIEAFWDSHMCLAMSVRSGYAFYALARGALDVVVGREPEFEDALPYAHSFPEFIHMLVRDG